MSLAQSKFSKLLLFVLTIAILVFMTIKFTKSKPYTKEFSASLQDQSSSLYPTNVESLMTNNSIYNPETGILISIDSGLEATSRGEYYEIKNNKKSNESTVILTSASGVFSTPLDVFENFRGLKERLTYNLGGKDYSTSLFDFSGDITSDTVGDKQVLIEKEKILLSDGKEGNAAFINTDMNFRALSIGMVSDTEVDIESLKQMLDNVHEVTYTGTKNTESLTFPNQVTVKGVNLTLPDGFTELDLSSHGSVFKPPLATCDPLYGSGIIVLEDNALEEDNEFSILDNTFRVSRDDYLKAFGLKDKIIQTSALSDERKQTINGQTYKSQEFGLILTPISTSDISTALPIELNCTVYSKLNDNGKTINIVLYGYPDISYQPLKSVAEKILKGGLSEY